MGGQFVRVQPGAQGELAPAEDFCGLHALDRVELGFDHPHQVVGDVIGGQGVAVEPQVHGIRGLPDGDRQHRLLGLGR